MSDADVAALSTDSLNVLFDLTFTRGTADPPVGALESLLSAGRLGVITNDTLRVHLAGWSGKVGDHAKNEENLRVIQRDKMVPWLQTQTPMAGRYGGSERYEPQVRDLFDSFIFDNYVREMITLTENILLTDHMVNAEIDFILKEIEGELK